VQREMEGMVSQPYHVIIADDDAGVRAVIGYIVRQTYPAVTISAVPNGLEALFVYDQYGANLVITNQAMPRLSGLDLIAVLHTRQTTLPIILVSGDAANAQPGLAAGATRFVAKPFTSTQLEQALTSVLPR
jgi:CheY-like chemotaxis protein